MLQYNIKHRLRAVSTSSKSRRSCCDILDAALKGVLKGPAEAVEPAREANSDRFPAKKTNYDLQRAGKVKHLKNIKLKTLINFVTLCLW